MMILAVVVGLLVSASIYLVTMFVVAFTMWMLVDASKQDRFWWVLLIVAVPVVGALVYYFTEKKHEYAKVPSHHVHQSETESQHEHAPHKHHEEERLDIRR